MRTFTKAEIEKLPKCLFQPFIPCTADNPPKREGAHEKCLACCLIGIQTALYEENIGGAMLCYDSALLVLKDLGVGLKL